jgi:hypothetical protein
MDLLYNERKKDIRNLDRMLLNLSPYGLDHHSREIAHLFPVFVENVLPSLNTYLQSRVIQTKSLKLVEKGVINNSIAPSSFWISEQE